MKILVAGATGVIGRWLVPLLVRAGHAVTGTTRRLAGAEWLPAAGARAAELDVLAAGAARRLLLELRPDAVIHQLTDLRALDLEANARLRIEGTRNLVEAALAAGVGRMVAQSIAFAYAPGEGLAREEDPLDLEAHPPRARTVEGVAALEQEVARLEIGTVLRYGALYGPGTFYAPGGLVAEQARAGTLVASPGVTSFLHVEDAALAAVEALGWPAGPVNVVDDEPATGSTWIPLLARRVGGPPPPVSGFRKPFERGASNARARQRLGWRPRYPTWLDGLGRPAEAPGPAGAGLA